MGMDDDIGTLYSKVGKIDVRLKEVETVLPFLKEMLERNIQTSEKLTDTLGEIQISMEHLNDKMEQQSLALENQKEEFAKTNQELNNRISNLDQKVDKLEEKGKFDIHMFLKTNWPWIIIVLGLGIGYVSKFVKF